MPVSKGPRSVPRQIQMAVVPLVIITGGQHSGRPPMAVMSRPSRHRRTFPLQERQ